MSTPAKKTTSSSLKDLLNDKKDDNTQEKNVDEKNNEKTQEENNEKNNNESSSDKPDEQQDASGVYVQGATGDVVREEDKDKPVDKEGTSKNRQVEGPNGVNFSEKAQTLAFSKTPFDLSSETPDETKERYGISDEIPDAVDKNPNVNVSADMGNFQIPGGTHLHPDIAKDRYNRNLDGAGAETASVTIQNSQNVYAAEAPVDDKGIKNEVPENLAQ